MRLDRKLVFLRDMHSPMRLLLIIPIPILYNLNFFNQKYIIFNYIP